MGGLNESLRLAGDFDLWRRMAVHAEYYCINSLTGIHRRRAGQLSSNMEAYTREVTELLKSELRPATPKQKYQGHHYYEMTEGRWKSTDDIEGGALQHFYLEALEHIIIYSRQHFKDVKARESPPWYLSSEGWRARTLKNQLVSAKRRLDNVIQESTGEGDSALRVPKI